jgi:hypothetical protein
MTTEPSITVDGVRFVRGSEVRVKRTGGGTQVCYVVGWITDRSVLIVTFPDGHSERIGASCVEKT